MYEYALLTIISITSLGILLGHLAMFVQHFRYMWPADVFLNIARVTLCQQRLPDPALPHFYDSIVLIVTSNGIAS